MIGTVFGTVYWVNDRCYSCGSGEQAVRKFQSWCKGCGKPVGTTLWTRKYLDAARPATGEREEE